MPPLNALHALHFEARCDACGARSRLVCTRELPMARHDAMAVLVHDGWEHVVGAHVAARAWMEREGVGRWTCRACNGK